MAGHHRWWAGELKDVPRANLVVQPGNRGTATAILHALIRILRQDEHAIVVVHPCDHGIASEVTLIAALDQAIASASGSSDLVLLGVVPDDPETEYGWIVPDGRDPGLHRVQAFVEKPHSPHAHRLREQGGLWNTFLFAVRARALFDHYIRSAPQLVDAYLAWIAEHGWDDQAMTGFYASLAPFDFSRDVLQHASSTLRVLPVHGSGWTDLGTPARVEAWLDRAHRSPATSETRATPGAAGAAR
jgi:mannose-1-phosphate guanylyltransferase